MIAISKAAAAAILEFLEDGDLVDFAEYCEEHGEKVDDVIRNIQRQLGEG